MPFLAGLLLHANAHAVAGCPVGMVRVEGRGVVGMRGQPYGVVQTAHLDKVEAPERDCPAAIEQTPNASVCWVQTDLADPVLGPRTVEVPPFCIEAYPFPGKGAAYTKDGLNVWTTHQMDLLFRTGKFGPRRLCTATEFQVAVAGPKNNRRFVYGDQYEAGRCQSETIGGDAGCKNEETGVHEYAAIHSHWAVADEAFVTFACDAGACNAAGNRRLKKGMYVVMGGTRRFQTRQAPITPHTWHDHGEPTPDGCAYDGWDDQVAVCAEEGPTNVEHEKAWAKFREDARKHQSMNAAMSSALGRPICPD